MSPTTETEIAAVSSAPRVTPADIEAEIASEHYFTAADGTAGYHPCLEVLINGLKNLQGGDKVLCDWDAARQLADQKRKPLELLTFCVLVLRNGAKVAGINYGAIDPAQHSAERGRQDARAQAVDKVYELLGFRLRDKLAGEASK